MEIGNDIIELLLVGKAALALLQATTYRLHSNKAHIVLFCTAQPAQIVICGEMGRGNYSVSNRPL